MKQNAKIIVIADNIRSIYNIGSIFRTCDAIGAEMLYLVGACSTPINQPTRLAKTALGAHNSVLWQYSPTISPVINKLKKEKYEVIALEIDKNSLDFRKWHPKSKVAIILGNEIEGIKQKTLNKCDKIVHLPMNKVKESLNVSVSFGAIGYYILSKTAS